MNNFQESLKVISLNDAIYQMLCDSCDGNRIIDLLLHLPTKYNVRRYSTSLLELKEKEEIVIEASVVKSDFSDGRGKIYLLFDGQYKVHICYLKCNSEYYSKLYIENSKVIISGKPKKHFGNWVFYHPTIISPMDTIKIEPQYRLSENTTNKVIRIGIDKCFKFLEYKCKENFDEWINDSYLKSNEWHSFIDSLKMIHLFQCEHDEEKVKKAKERLAFDELLITQATFQKFRSTQKVEKKSIKSEMILVKRILENLSFELTDDQKQVMQEIFLDQESTQKMTRLLQGDVGSGKTIVAICAMLNAVEAGYQVALMVPTEILAQQHFNYIKSIIPEEIDIVCLTSTAQKKKKLLISIATGQAKIVVGTHSLFQEQVEFHSLGLVVIDEQHRFGVEHRQMLQDKNAQADLLLMSATPIPRSLNMTKYGHLDHSIIYSKPSNRKEIQTILIPLYEVEKLVAKIKQFLSKNEQVYWICPLINESEKLNFAAIKMREQFLKSYFPDDLLIIHGEMKDSEIDICMKQFINAEKKILLSTTIVEVGLNAPNATLIIIEDSQRFGLSQLHQLRGRVGRSDKQSYCVLLFNSINITSTGMSRLKALAKSTDGFYLSEVDLRIRGSGDVIKTKQSGFNKYKIANLKEDEALMEKASKYINDHQISDQDLDLMKRIFNVSSEFLS